jgi:sodium-dependent phosphate cotransporter
LQREKDLAIQEMVSTLSFVNPVIGLIACNKDTGHCPAFFQADATSSGDKVSGGVIFFISIMILFTCLLGLVYLTQRMLLGMSSRIVYKATNVNGYLAILIGAGITLVVQSSSITTSTLTPLVGMGVLRLEQMYPLTLRANIGTTCTALMAVMVTEGTQSLQVALAHLIFNITGIVMFHPIPFMLFPIPLARQLGQATRIWRGFLMVYIGVLFFLLPLIFLGISCIFEQDTKGYTVLGSCIVVVLGLGMMCTAYHCQFQGGKENCIECMQKRERQRVALKDLAEDMDYLKSKSSALAEHTGLPEKEEEGEEMETLIEKGKENIDSEEEIEA